MSLRIWLPLDGSLRNLGVDDLSVTGSTNITVDTNGKIGSCYAYNGTSGQILLDNFNWTGWKQCSVCCWIYPTADPWYLFLVRGNTQHRFRINSGGLAFRDSNNSTIRTVTWTNNIPLNTWTHITVTYDQGKVCIYQNGILDKESTTYYNTSSSLLASDTDVRIGRLLSTDGSTYLTGKVNDFRIYDHCLSMAEVHEISLGLVLHYKLDNINNNVCEDSSGYNNNGEITGNITLNSNTPRYSLSSSFNGTERITTITPGADIRTLSCWCKTTKNKTTSLFMVADSFSNMAITFYLGNIIGVLGTTRSTGSKSVLGDSYKENDWNHIVVVKTNDSGARDIYCNGVKLTPTSNDYWSATTGFFVGARNTSTALPFYGLISDVRAYCTAFNENEILLLYHTSAKIDNKSNLHTFEFNENNLNKITKSGQINCTQVSELNELSFLKYDPNTYIEPDGSCWIRIYHHNNPGAGSFSSSNDFAHSVYIDENRWFNVEVCNYVDKWEFMIKGKYTSSGNEWKLRFIQNVNPMTAVYADVAAANVTKITGNGYSSYLSSWGGLYAKKSSAYLTTNNGNSGNWWGAVGSYSVYQNGIPGWGTSNTVTTTGYNDLYLRIDNVTFTTIKAKTTKNNMWFGNHIIEF